MKAAFLIVFFCTISLLDFGQETHGALNSNYSPTNSVHLNPSSILDAKTWLDIHIVGAGAYLNNTLSAAENTTVLRLFQNNLTRENLTFASGINRYNAYNRNFVQALSAVWSQGDHAAAISFGAYSYTDIRRVNEPVARFIENGIASYTPQHLTDFQWNRARANALAYGEAKFTYAHTFHKRQRNMFMMGISYKKIFPVGGGAASIRNLGYNVLNDTALFIDRFQGDFMSSTEPEFSFKGGWGFDLGFTYQRMYTGCDSYYPNSRKGGCNRLYYKYKIGVSITDLGYARFNPENINYVGYDLGQNTVLNYADLTTSAAGFPTILANLENHPETGLIRNPQHMSLPTALSVQFDRNILPHFVYFNITWVHGLSPRKAAFGPRRAHSLSFTPRIETKWFDFALPVSVYEYQRFQLGASFRLYFLTIGTDKLLNFFVPSDIYGADLYFHLKVPLFRNPKCKFKGDGFGGGMGNKGGWKGRKYPKCDAYR